MRMAEYESNENATSAPVTVANINAGLAEAGAGIIVFSRHSRNSRWVEAETSYLTDARIEGQKILIPVALGEDCFVPPLLGPLGRLPIRSRP